MTRSRFRGLAPVVLLGIVVLPGAALAKLPKKSEGLLKDGTAIVRHLDAGDIDTYEIKGFDDKKGKYILRNTEDSSETMVTPVTSFEWGPKDKADESRKDWEKSREEADKSLGENYLSGDYKALNTLSTALFNCKIKMSDIASSKFKLKQGKEDDAIIKEWKEVKKARGYKDEEIQIDETTLDTYFIMLKRIVRVWKKFDEPTKKFQKKDFFKEGYVYRGDSTYLYKAYPVTDPAKYKGDGEHVVDTTIEWVGFMSTTVVDPKSHNYVNSKSIVWKIKLNKDHSARILGGNNPSEAEVTFPPGTKLHVTKVIVRTKDKSVQKDEFGDKAEIIVEAETVDE